MNWYRHLLDRLSTKVYVALFLSAVIPLLSYVVLINVNVNNSFEKLERNCIETGIERVLQVLKNESQAIEVHARDYAMWDSMYENASEKNYDWIAKNTSEWIPDAMRYDLSVVALYDNEVLDSYGVENLDLERLFEQDIVQQAFNKDGYYEELGLNAIYEDNGEIYLIGTSSILNNTEGPSIGAIIFGKKVTEGFLEEIETKYGLNIFIVNNKGDHIGNSEFDGYDSKVESIYDTQIVVNDTNVLGLESIKATDGEVLGSIGLIESRATFLSTINILHENDMKIFLVAFVMIAFLGHILKNIITRPIKKLGIQILQMKKDGYPGHVSEDGPCEIANLARTFNDITDFMLMQKDDNNSLVRETRTDNLTSLFNHRFFYEYLDLRKYNITTGYTVIFCDIDHFKAINDTHGHIVGDKVLSMIANVIIESLDKNMKAFRYGGEEYAVLLENCSSEKGFLLAEEIREKISLDSEIQKHTAEGPISMSFGIANYPEHTSEVEKLIKKADMAMYFAKQNGRNQSYIYTDEMDQFLMKNSMDSAKKKMLSNSVSSLTAAIDARDEYTGKHSEFVSRYSLMIAEDMCLSVKEWENLEVGALLHDCGKIGISDEIIHKKGSLTADEYRIIKQHTVLGYNIVKHIVDDSDILGCVRNHHERWDGNGYPDGLREELIPILARIICVADAFHAMTSSRPYREALSFNEACNQLKENRGTQFDPVVTDVFLRKIGIG